MQSRWAQITLIFHKHVALYRLRFCYSGHNDLYNAVIEIEELRCDMNADFVEQLADSERFDEGRFSKQRRDYEKRWRDPDDVYIDVERCSPQSAQRFRHRLESRASS